MKASPFLSEDAGHGTDPHPLDTGDLAPMPGNQYQHQCDKKRANGQATYPHRQNDTVAREVAETYREVSWFASTLKQAWPYIVIVVAAIFTAGGAYQKLQASQDKIEAVAKKVDAHDAILTSILEKVAEVKGVIVGQNRQFAATPPIPAYPPQKAASAPPALPIPAANPPKRNHPRKPAPAACSGILCVLRN